MFDWVDTASERAIEKLFLKLLESFDNDDLQKATDENLSLLLLTQEHRPKLLRTASAIAGRFRVQGYLLTYQNVLSWLKEHHRSLWFSIQLDKKKQKWLENQVNIFHKFLFES